MVKSERPNCRNRTGIACSARGQVGAERCGPVNCSVERRRRSLWRTRLGVEAHDEEIPGLVCIGGGDWFRRARRRPDPEEPTGGPVAAQRSATPDTGRSRWIACSGSTTRGRRRRRTAWRRKRTARPPSRCLAPAASGLLVSFRSRGRVSTCSSLRASAWAPGSASSHGSDDQTPTGGTTTNVSFTGVMFAPRIGYVARLAPSISFWPRAGVSIYYITLDSRAAVSTRRCISSRPRPRPRSSSPSRPAWPSPSARPST